MRNNSRRICFTLSILLAVGGLSTSPGAPDDPGEKPKPPFLAEMKEPATITRVFSTAAERSEKKQGDNPPATVLRSITEIYNPVRRIQQFFSDRPAPAVLWVADGVMLGDHPTVSGSTYYDEGATSGTGSDLVSVFPEAKWVRLENFTKWETIDGQLYRVHEAVLAPSKNVYGEENPNILSGAVIVWISDATRRPLKVKTGTNTISFSYSAGPSSPLTVPPSVAKTLQSLRYGPAGQMR
jgi:hypothetical protein